MREISYATLKGRVELERRKKLDAYQNPRHDTPSLLLSFVWGSELEQQEAWEKIIAVFADPLYRFFISKGASGSDAEDLVQNTFASVYSSFSNKEKPEKGTLKLSAYVFTAAKRKLFDHYKQMNKGQGALGGTENRAIVEKIKQAPYSDSFSRDGSSASKREPEFLDDHELRKFSKDLLREAVEHTKGRNRKPEGWQAFELRILEGLSYKEITERLQIGESAAKLQVKRNLARIREFLSKYDTDEILNLLGIAIDQTDDSEPDDAED